MYSYVITSNNSSANKKNDSSTKKNDSSTGKTNSDYKEKLKICESKKEEAKKNYMIQTTAAAGACAVKAALTFAKKPVIGPVGTGIEFIECMAVQQVGSLIVLNDKLDSINEECAIIYQGDSAEDDEKSSTNEQYKQGSRSSDKDFNSTSYSNNRPVAINYTSEFDRYRQDINTKGYSDATFTV